MIEYGRKPYLTSNYVDMMRQTTDKYADNKYIVVQSVYKKPYLNAGYQEMEHAQPTLAGTVFNTKDGWDFNGMKNFSPDNFAPFKNNQKYKSVKTKWNYETDEEKYNILQDISKPSWVDDRIDTNVKEDNWEAIHAWLTFVSLPGGPWERLYVYYFSGQWIVRQMAWGSGFPFPLDLTSYYATEPSPPSADPGGSIEQLF